ncbi:hypothetical protein [Dactylosporangium sp. CA-092794]|uniref:hypothetical protein n=1 Tax=Dactylosporangium sp. CA-092794 TaxID=3239929 RepID=UPI003D915B53
MDAAPAGIESELPDLSTVNVTTLRSVALPALGDAMERVRRRILSAEDSVSGYNGNGAYGEPEALAGPFPDGHAA